MGTIFMNAQISGFFFLLNSLVMFFKICTADLAADTFKFPTITFRSVYPVDLDTHLPTMGVRLLSFYWLLLPAAPIAFAPD
jgi:hypothetical protein